MASEATCPVCGRRLWAAGDPVVASGLCYGSGNDRRCLWLAVERVTRELDEALAVLRELDATHAESSAFDSWECDYGCHLGECPTSNNCLPCEFQKRRKKLAALLAAADARAGR